MSIDRAGEIGGTFSENATGHGFVREPDGTITAFDPPGSIGASALNINRAGAIVGYWLDTDYMTQHGFLRTSDGKIRSFRCRGSVQTYPLAINDNGSIVGFCYPPTGGHAFLRQRQ
jgi:uncharacterized membrane protein